MRFTKALTFRHILERVPLTLIQPPPYHIVNKCCDQGTWATTLLRNILNIGQFTIFKITKVVDHQRLEVATKVEITKHLKLLKAVNI